MAEPCPFEHQNFVWKGWDNEKGEKEVLDLPAWKGEGRTISCWKLTWRERLAALFGGRLWMHVFSSHHPPVYVSPESPFHAE